MCRHLRKPAQQRPSLGCRCQLPPPVRYCAAIVRLASCDVQQQLAGVQQCIVCCRVSRRHAGRGAGRCALLSIACQQAQHSRLAQGLQPLRVLRCLMLAPPLIPWVADLQQQGQQEGSTFRR